MANQRLKLYLLLDVERTSGIVGSLAYLGAQCPKYQDTPLPKLITPDSSSPRNYQCYYRQAASWQTTFPVMISCIVISSYSSSTDPVCNLVEGGGGGGVKQFPIFFSFFLGTPSMGLLEPDDEATLVAALGLVL